MANSTKSPPASGGGSRRLTELVLAAVFLLAVTVGFIMVGAKGESAKM